MKTTKQIIYDIIGVASLIAAGASLIIISLSPDNHDVAE